MEDIRHQHTYEGVLLDESLIKVFDAIHNNMFGNADEFKALTNTVINHDHWLTSADFASYVKTQESIDVAFKDQENWLRKTIVSVSRMGFFSSDRCIEEYAECKSIPEFVVLFWQATDFLLLAIWNAEPVDPPFTFKSGGTSQNGA